ncbi:hypothetical protein DSO57_1006170 [Entomophthora muscae]|uniref:Uncharacterized protein n=1 Tax=Entomophthora muscae TaxID=34485 RepID=A0ACC2UUC4_9FUNG|nr:hypothetical protein DSO57_1006170 [Entomophthora muscae]
MHPERGRRTVQTNHRYRSPHSAQRIAKKKFPGPDNILAEAYNNLKAVIVPLMVKMFNWCLDNETQLHSGNKVKICMLFKKGSQQQLNVRNIPDINQISTREKCWNQVDKCSTGEAKFDREFPSLSGEKKNQNLGKTDFYGSWNNLTSRQAPATLCQPPTTLCEPPARRQSPACQPATRQPPTRLPTPLPADPPLAPRPPARSLTPSQLPAAHPGPRAHFPANQSPS